jgi:hypothetical protein
VRPFEEEIPMRRPILLALAALLAAAPAFARPSVEVNTCGQVVPKGYLGYLIADLDCTGYEGAPGAVIVGNGGIFDLRGFTLTTDDTFGVYCGGLTETNGDLNPCTVMNGTITGGQTGHGIIGKRIKAANLVIDSAAVMGIFADGALKGENLSISGAGECGIRSDSPARLVDSTITTNGQYGFCGKSVRLYGSTVTGNGVTDLRSEKRPFLKNSTCGSSESPNPPYTWGVCTLD